MEIGKQVGKPIRVPLRQPVRPLETPRPVTPEKPILAPNWPVRRPEPPLVPCPPSPDR
jgi:hypothetical protein